MATSRIAVSSSVFPVRLESGWEAWEHRCVAEGEGIEFHMTVRQDERFFTVYDNSGNPVGTVSRPRVTDRIRYWTVSTLDGTPVTRLSGRGFVGPFTALLGLMRHHVATRQQVV